MPSDSVRESLELQAQSCAAMGSSLYSALLTGLIDDYDRSGLTATTLDGVTDRPRHDALPLRYLASGHRLALGGSAPAIAAHLPSCGGHWRDSPDVARALVSAFLATVEEQPEAFRNGVRQNVQTNEIGRAAVLACGLTLIAQRSRLPIVQLEIGASAGLLSNWDSYRFDTGRAAFGAERSELTFGPEWWHAAGPSFTTTARIAQRRASDISPIDTSTEQGRILMQSFVWPDQVERLERLRAAMNVASQNPLTVDRADAGEWLHEQLDRVPQAGLATVVFHSIVWQYLPKSTRNAVRSALAEAGDKAAEDSPVLWLRMEPATADHADLRLTSYPGGHDEVLAHVGYHGANIRWLA